MVKAGSQSSTSPDFSHLHYALSEDDQSRLSELGKATEYLADFVAASFGDTENGIEAHMLAPVLRVLSYVVTDIANKAPWTGVQGTKN